MKTKYRISVILLSLSATAPVLADSIYDKCIDEVGTQHPEDTACGAAYLERIERKLNEVWQVTYGKFTGKAKNDLLLEQRAWIAYKDKSCELYRNDIFGTLGERIRYYGCRGAVIEDRVKELERYADTMDGY
jgi:uncharacterized protein YecT (DUF1311 family)